MYCPRATGYAENIHLGELTHTNTHTRALKLSPTHLPTHPCIFLLSSYPSTHTHTQTKPAVGDAYDPTTMEAAAFVAGDADDVVVSVESKGYRIGEKVVRRAVVIAAATEATLASRAKKGGDADEESTEEEEAGGAEEE